ncbi:peptidylprolyl isomerase [Cyanobium sp. WAJ14-Wanaka]|uniref:peptidylprolyl isomerase n=1 Tax=Cyanobium sp. WAJ14-Wanaka TaxID=2823725 RepID=UPI0020CB8FF8|nr:peptidylprolyl isomerase [Cyanobium sp. WAJ14-Wanaka]MCP9775437.1 peptidylprolyl isomerase [Cyanobium sp. WAJ14-Wanaka]
MASVELDSAESESALQNFASQQQLADQAALDSFCQANLITLADLQFWAERPIRVRKYCDVHFEPKVEARFLDRKNSLDRVVYSLIRLNDRGMARELYLQISAGEADFAVLAAEFSEGPERQTRGIVGPVPLNQAHPNLAERLRITRPGVLLEPFKIEDWWLVARLESLQPAQLDSPMRQAMAEELMEEWIKAEVAREASALATDLQLSKS